MVARIPLEPGFLFSRELLEAAIPELLAQTGTTGQQFAHLLIRSYQEMAQNDFPDLERSAEEIGERRFPLTVDDLLRLCKRHGVKIQWFDRKPLLARNNDREVRSVMRSFFEAPGTVYANRQLQKDPARLKFDLASHLAHKILHGGDGLKSAHATGGEMGGSPTGSIENAGGMNAQDVLSAWRDFECGFFAGALLCPKRPFRRFLARESYRVEACSKLELTPAVVMRRMTAVSPYRHWHFFDAYPPGYLRAVYRGDGPPPCRGGTSPWSPTLARTGRCSGCSTRARLHSQRRRSPCSSTVSVHCSTAVTRCVPATWPGTRMCCRWASTWCRRWNHRDSMPKRSWRASIRPANATGARRRCQALPPAQSARLAAC